MNVKLNNTHLERIDVAGHPGLWVYLPKNAVGEEAWQDLVAKLEHKFIGSQDAQVKVSGTLDLEVLPNES